MILRRFICCHTTMEASELAVLFLWVVVCLNVLMLTIVLDREPQFPSIFWGQVCDSEGIDQTMWMPFRPQTTDKRNEWMWVWSWTWRFLLTISRMTGWSGCLWLNIGQIMGRQNWHSVHHVSQFKHVIPRCHPSPNEWRSHTNNAWMEIRFRQLFNKSMSISEWKWGETRQCRKKKRIENKFQHQISRRNHRCGWMPDIFKLQNPRGSWIWSGYGCIRLSVGYPHLLMS